MIPGGHTTLRFADPPRPALPAAARLLDPIGRDDDAPTLRVPGDGGVRSLRGLIDRLDRAEVEVSELTVHTPDLDDVFLALTGRKEEVR